MKKKVKYTRTPTGKTKRIVYRKKGKQPKCAECEAKLPGIKKRTSSKTNRRAERKYPHLCSRCAREKIKKEAVENLVG